MLRSVVLAISALGLLVALGAQHTFAQIPECPPADVLLRKDNPDYSDAMALAAELREHGFVIQCAFPSKLGSIFQVNEGGRLHSTIEGEVVYRTNQGDIEVVFLPKPQTFDDFKVTEHREEGGWWYSFAGTPRVWAGNRLEGRRRTYFVKRGAQMFILYEGKLRNRLIKELHLS